MNKLKHNHSLSICGLLQNGGSPLRQLDSSSPSIHLAEVCAVTSVESQGQLPVLLHVFLVVCLFDWFDWFVCVLTYVDGNACKCYQQCAVAPVCTVKNGSLL